MRRAFILLLLIFLASMPLVFAEEVYYYPSRVAVNSFLSSNLTYKVIPGNSTWTKEWGIIIDKTFESILNRAENPKSLVLVGNVKNNALMRKIWYMTGLPQNYSFYPGVIILQKDHFILFTGSRDNFYKTMEVFNSLEMPLTYRVVMYFLIVIFGVLFFLELKKCEGGVAYSYILILIMYLVWISNISTPQISLDFYKFLGQIMDKAPYLFNYLNEYFPISIFTLEMSSLIVLFILASLSFYIVPPHSRDVGFVVFGLLFTTPLIREYAHLVSVEVFGLLFLALFLAVLSNIDFPKKMRVLRVLTFIILGGLTVLMYLINFFLLMIVPAVVIAYLKRKSEIIAYIIFILVSLWILGFPTLSSLSFNWTLGINFLLNSLLPLLLFMYSYLKLLREDIKFPIGQDMVVFLAFIFLLPGIIVNSAHLTSYEILLLSSLAVRAVTMLREEELERVRRSLESHSSQT